MTFVEFYKYLGDTALNSGMVLAAIYSVLSLIYFGYRYAKGDDIPKFNSLPEITLSNLSDIRVYVNPFYFKHPMLYVSTAFSIISIPFIVGVGWPVLIPFAAISYLVQRTRNDSRYYSYFQR